MPPMNIFVSVIISRNRRPAAACAPLMTRLPLGGKTRGGCPDFPPDFPPEFPPDFGPTFLNRNFRVQTHPILPTPPDFRFQIRVVPPEFGRSEQIRVENRVENRVGDPIFHPIFDPNLQQKPPIKFWISGRCEHPRGENFQICSSGCSRKFLIG